MADSGIEVENLQQVQAAVAAVAATVDQTASTEISRWTVEQEARLRTAAARSSRQAAMVAGSIRARRALGGGRIETGGPGSLPSGTGSYGDVFFGAEFGGGSRPATRQFRPYRRTGYWFFPTLEAADHDLEAAAEEALDKAAARWAD